MPRHSNITYKMPMKGRWVEWDDAKLMELGRAGQADAADWFRAEYAKYQRNKLAHFLPHGAPWHKGDLVLGDGALRIPESPYPKAWRNDATAFLNDWASDISMMVAPNQSGKSCIGVIWSALRIIPCDPEWPIFRDHGVEFHEWSGPKIWVVSSYSWDNVATVWNQYCEFLPREQIGTYAPGYGQHEGETERAQSLSFGDGKPKTITLKCGTVLKFLCDTQAQAHWEGFRSDGMHADEQREKEKFVGWMRSTTTRGDYTPCCMTLTGHVLEDRPDTGACGWIKRELWDGINTQGRKVGRYQITVDDVPSAILSDKKRLELYDQWVNPEIKRSEKDKRAGVARYWGGWESSGGLVLSEWDMKIHTCDPFEIPKTWTRYRIIDPGHMSAAMLIAVSPNDNAYVYAEYYLKDRDVMQMAGDIVELSGNKRVLMDNLKDENTGVSWPIYDEEFCGTQFEASHLDSRSFGTKTATGLTTGALFNRCGLYCTPSNGQHRERVLIPLLLPWFAVDWEKPHPQWGGKGCSRMFVFNNLKNTIWEIGGWTRDPETGKASEKNDHLISCLLYFAGADPHYYGMPEKASKNEPWERREKKRAETWSAY